MVFRSSLRGSPGVVETKLNLSRPSVLSARLRYCSKALNELLCPHCSLINDSLMLHYQMLVVIFNQSPVLCISSFLQVIFMGLECLQPSGIQPKRIFVLQLLDKTREIERKNSVVLLAGQWQISHQSQRCQARHKSDPSDPEPSSGPKLCPIYHPAP